MERPRYPLTPAAKQVAKAIAEKWQAGKFEQRMLLGAFAHANGRYEPAWVNLETSEFIEWVPSVANILELGEYGLISTTPHYDTMGVRVLLLQELLDAVENDFRVSDYFLTLNAVGTIVHGDLNIERGGLYQSAAGVHATNVNVGKLVGDLRVAVGETALRENPALAEAITDLEQPADEPTRREKLGKVVLELGRCMEHVTNFAGTLAAIGMFAQMFGG